jgi:hypothetical protein
MHGAADESDPTDHISHVRKSLEAEVGAGVVEHQEVEAEDQAAMEDLGSRRRSMGDI